MDNRGEVQDFLASRRARITPQQAGLPAYGANRRVSGLRREEAERVHLVDVARAAGSTPAKARRRPPQGEVRGSIRAILDAMTGAPAVVRNDRLDILVTNSLGRALYVPLYRDPVRPANHARFAFLDPAAQDFWDDWQRAADDTVGILRALAGRNPYDKALSDLIGELSTRSEDFRVRWARHDVRLHRTGNKVINHPVVGRLELMYETLRLPADPGLTLLVYTAEPAAPPTTRSPCWPVGRRPSTRPTRHPPQKERDRTLKNCSKETTSWKFAHSARDCRSRRSASAAWV